MITKGFRLKNKQGLHARPAGVLVKIAKSCGDTVSMEYNGKKFDAKSILAVMSAGIVGGSDITFIIDGESEQETMVLMEEAINNKFGETE